MFLFYAFIDVYKKKLNSEIKVQKKDLYSYLITIIIIIIQHFGRKRDWFSKGMEKALHDNTFVHLLSDKNALQSISFRLTLVRRMIVSKSIIIGSIILRSVIIKNKETIPREPHNISSWKYKMY